MAPESRVVYVDNDPIVLAHARALLTGAPEGKTAYVDADLYEPDKILEAAAETLDLDQPVALMLMGIMGHVGDFDEARSIVRRLLRPLPSGSYLALDDGTDVIDKAAVERPKGPTTKAARSRTTPAAPSRSPASSRGWSSSSPVWCRVRGGGPTAPTLALPRSWTPSVGWAASRSADGPRPPARVGDIGSGRAGLAAPAPLHERLTGVECCGWLCPEMFPDIGGAPP